MLVDESTDARVESRAVVAPSAAAAAGAKALGPGGIRFAEEKHARAQRTPRGTRRPAIDAGRSHGVNELAVKARVALFHGAPVASFLIHEPSPKTILAASRTIMQRTSSPSLPEDCAQSRV